MTVVSVRDFRANQGKYLGLAASGESVILTSRKGHFKIVPISEDGGGTKVSSEKELSSFLGSL